MADRLFIGDVHGHADELEALLAESGFQLTGGAWRHPSMTAVFCGDYIDRGPRQLDVVGIVRRMVDAGSAEAIQGNHEFNAVAWATEIPEEPGRHFRVRGSKNRAQHAAFLDAVGNDSDLHKEIVAWFRSLPLWTEFDGAVAIHACWHRDLQAELARLTDAKHVLTEEGWLQALTKGTRAYEITETLLKGPEVALPHGVTFFDKDGHERKNTRVRWWDEEATTFRSAALVDEETASFLPEEAIGSDWLADLGEERLVFFGHYWMAGEPRILHPRRTCLDFSVAKAGHLAAYRHEGETELDPEHLVWAGKPALGMQPAR
jgi:hypothetical protein